MNQWLEIGKDPGPPSREMIFAMILPHAAMECDFKGEKIAMREMRKHVAWYTAGLKYSAKLRARVNEVSTYAQLEELLNGAR